MKNEPLHILLVEDDDDHAEIVFRGLAMSPVLKEIHRVSDGEAALDYLFRRGTFADAARSPKPNLILLDLRLPKIDGREVLSIVKESKDLRCIPMVILTTSNTQLDVASAYQNHANGYLVKPVDFGKFTEMMNAISVYWLAWNRPPFEAEGE